MKTREQKQRDLEALSQQFQAATAGMLVGFTKLTVSKDQELRNRLREAGPEYS
jgi:ribosomal protein L10